MATLDRLLPVFRDVFDDDSITLSAETTADHIKGWDSMAHVNLVVAIEDEFDVAFTAAEAANFKSVGDLVALLEQRLS